MESRIASMIRNSILNRNVKVPMEVPVIRLITNGSPETGDV